ncbi:unnamed protein product [Orchesella dallaii]|uniref:Reverse transcriptase domain-containing protein n=1 Tax=Orchesella dallaii TaxID=48710 RepID=A0ABP1S587_9HEXA
MSSHPNLDLHPKELLQSWLIENYEEAGEDESVLKSTIYDAFIIKYPDSSLSKPTIGKTIYQIFPKIGTKRKGPKGHLAYHYTGIKERKRYCLCRTTSDEGFMIQCAICGEWLHGNCVNISEGEAKAIDDYACPVCVEEYIHNDINSENPPSSQHKCDECGVCFPSAIGLSHHIRHKHHEWYRRILAGTQPNTNTQPCPQNSQAITASKLDIIKIELKQITGKLNVLMTASALDEDEFDRVYLELVNLLTVANDALPGPKHPATKFYTMRKKRNLFKDNQAGYKKTSNPQRTTKKARERRKDKYNYELMQYLYYNKRKSCVRKITQQNDIKCKIPLDVLHQSLSNKWGIENPSIRRQYEDAPSENDQHIIDLDYSTKISSDEVKDSLKMMDNDSSPGPDNITIRALKHTEAWDCLAALFSIFHKWNFLPSKLKEAYTILIYKDGPVEDPANWRPISICSSIRRLYEKIILLRMKKYVAVSPFQTGSQNIPGTFVNTSIINGCLNKAKMDEIDLSIILLDVAKAFDCIGHTHITNTINSLPFPTELKLMLVSLVKGNVTRIRNGNETSQPLQFERGIFQGSVISPEIFNLAIDFILKSLTEDEIATKFGFKVHPDLSPLTAAGFMDDTALIAKNQDSACELSLMAKDLFNEIGLELNVKKTQAICIKNGCLSNEDFSFGNNNKIQVLKEGERIKYLGVNFRDEIVLDTSKVLSDLQKSISTLVTSPMLHPDQKIQIINQFIWPKIVYPLQSAPTSKIPKAFLESVDKMMRSCAREILQLPQDTPNSMFYTSCSNKGLHLFSAAWEANLQNYSICNRLRHTGNDYVKVLRDLDEEMKIALEKLNITYELYHNIIKDCKTGTSINRKLRDYLRSVEFKKWSELKFHGRGVETFDCCPAINRSLYSKIGLSSSEWTSYWKMITNTVPVRVLHGRSQGSVRCRRCNENVETLGHVLGICPYGELLRNERHHRIRRMLADQLRNLNYEVYEEVPTIDRRIDIIAIHHDTETALVLDPTVRLEMSCQQPEEVDIEKKSIYDPCLEDLRLKYNLPNNYSMKVIGLMIGARGVIPSHVSEVFEKLKFPKQFVMDIAISAVKGSCRILHNHLYSPLN